MLPLLVHLPLRFFPLLRILHLAGDLHDLDLCQWASKAIIEGKCIARVDFAAFGRLEEDSKLATG